MSFCTPAEEITCPLGEKICEILHKAMLNTLEMDGDSDEDYERMSQADISEPEDDDFGETLHETPNSTPPALTPPTTLLPCRTKRFHCTWDGCSKVFVRQSRLDEHLRTHTNERPFTCPHNGCDKAYFRDSHLKTHIKSAHTHEKDYQCTWEGCDKSFATGQRLRNHLKVHEGQQKYKCTGYQGCSEIFRKKDTLRRHVVSVHEKRRPYPCPDINSMTGEKCTKEFDTAQKLRNHQKTNHDKTRFSCAECLAENATAFALFPGVDDPVLRNAYFATMAELQLHNAQFHPPKCPQCQALFGTQRQLTTHRELVHDVKPAAADDCAARNDFKCPYPDCEKSYSKKGNLNVHIRSFHEKSLKFTCGQTQAALQQDEIPPGTVIAGCGKSFTSKQVLEDHIRTTHLGLTSLQTRRKRKAAKSGGKKTKRSRFDSAYLDFDGDSNTNRSEEVPDFVWPAVGYDDDDEKDIMDLSESMSLVGSHIYHHGSAYHYPSGEYPSSSNSLELGHGSYQPIDDHVNDRSFGEFEDFYDVSPIDPLLSAAAPEA